MKERSLSARRAWIEIQVLPIMVASKPVALRKESVDRNTKGGRITTTIAVALRKESVDRNLGILALKQTPLSRSPQGERG